MRAVLIVALLIAGFLLAVTVLPVRRQFQRKFCRDCGLVRQDTAVFGLHRSRFERNSFTEWYDSRIGKLHPHRWMTCSEDDSLSMTL